MKPSPRPHEGVPLLLRALIQLYPRRFVERYGAAMLEFCGERLVDATRSSEPRFRLWRRVVGDLVTGLAIEWVRALTARRAIEHQLFSYSSYPSPSEDQMSGIAHDLVYAARSLRKSAAFTAAAVVTLALGISSTTAIFSVVQSVLLAPLPYPGADRIVVPQSRTPNTNETWSVTYADFMDWRDNKVFDKVAVLQATQMDLTGSAEPVRVQAAAVSPQFFGALGVAPAMGRVLQPVDYPVDAPRAVVISDRLWRTQFGARSDIAGLTVEISGIKRPIVGVLPAGARWPIDTDLWVPMRFTTEQDPDLQRRDNYIFMGIARLKAGSSLAATQASMATLAARIAAEQPTIRKDVTTVPTPVLEWALGSTTPRALWMLLGAVGLLLLIGCVNVANLQLARAAARQRELAVRTALGASRLRLVRQTLVESLVLGLVGGTAGVVLATWMVKLIVAVAPADVPRIDTARLDLPALAFALALSLAVALLFGVFPAVHAARSDPSHALGEGGTRTSVGRAGTRTRRTLVVVELALSVVLLVGAGLALRSVSNLRRVNTGFDTRNTLTASISLPGIRYDNKAKVVGFIYQLRDRLAAAPGVEAAGIASASPLGGGGFYLGRMMVAEGRDASPANEVPIQWNVTTPGYFAALRVPIVRGRDFTARDDTASPPVMIVNQQFAKAMFPNENPIGKRAMSSRDEKVYREIVGVVRDVKYYGANDSTRSLVWVPYAQNNAWRQGIITVRTRANPSSALASVRAELRALDGGIALANVSTMDEAMARSMAGDRLVAILLGAFAGLALVLAAIGIFGVLSYTVEQRTHELGIRVALGAQRADVLRLVVRETVPMIGAGIVIGGVAAFGLTRFLRSLLYEITPSDPGTFVAVALLLSVVGLIAALVPARRAARVDPVLALRSE
jgi:putative ABC transport system permease protein